MGRYSVSQETRAKIVIAISCSFFVAQISIGFKTRSLALVADAFHCLNDLITFIVALIALRLKNKKTSPSSLTFGWKRADLLGAFFNSVFILALGVSIFLQSIERFILPEDVDSPLLVFIMGFVGVAVNITMAFVYAGHHHHGHDHHGHTHSQDEHKTEESLDLVRRLKAFSFYFPANPGAGACPTNQCRGRRA